jgi:primosomal protein N' (replication factor Y)
MRGGFVAIPFRSKTVAGLVSDIFEQNDARLKSIIRPLPLVYRSPEEQLAYFDWFARTYFISRATALFTLLPAFPPSYLSGKEQKQKTATRTPLHEYSEVIQTYCTPPLEEHAEHSSPLIVSCTTVRDAYSFYRSETERALATNNSICIVTPTIHDAELLGAIMREWVGSNRVLLFHSGRSKNALFKNWTLLFEKQPYCIIGTRSALCAPLHSVRTIIIDQAERTEHIQYDMNPRFDVRRASSAIQTLRPTSVFLSTPAPRVEDHAHYDMTTVEKEKRHLGTLVVNLSDALRAGTADTLVSEQLRNTITETLGRGRGVFLFCNRTGSGSHMLCTGCGHLWMCPSCSTLLKPFQNSARLACTMCHHTEQMPTLCSTCASPALKTIGMGTEKVVNALSGMFGEHPCHELSLEHSRDPWSSALHSSDGRQQSRVSESIVVGTSYALSACPELFSDIGLIGILHADPLLSVHDFRSVERQWQTLARLRFFASSFEASLLIQAFRPDLPFIQTLIRDDYTSYATQEREERKKTGAPPTCASIHLLYRPLFRTTAQEQKQTINDVVGYFSSPVKDIRCSLLLHRPIRNDRRSGTYEIVIRIAPADSREDIPQSLREYIGQLPNEWIVDIEPLFF